MEQIKVKKQPTVKKRKKRRPLSPQEAYQRRLLIEKRRRKRMLKEGLTAFVLGSVLIFITLYFFLAFPKMDGYSMTPSLYDGERLVVVKHAKLIRFRLIAFRDEGTNMIKIRRLIGLPSEKINYHGDVLMVNDKERTESFIKSALSDYGSGGMQFTEDFSSESLSGSETIPKDEYLVMGDNRPYSTDSRYFGLIKRKQIIGVAYYKLDKLEPLIE
ncbi:MAG: signal peptidase I [Lactobacillales bacterium]|jgi:signal peptidase I|nr:signal peptidase I [Lactobacillales bacterium]